VESCSLESVISRLRTRLASPTSSPGLLLGLALITGCSDDGFAGGAASASSTDASTGPVSTGPASTTPASTGPASTGQSTTEALDDTGPLDESTGGTEGETDPGPLLDCSILAEGTVSGFVVDGMERELILNLPAGVEDGGPWPVVFNWHGLGDDAAGMSALVAPHVDNAIMPFIAVTPEDTDYMLDVPIPGLPPMDWEVFAVDPTNNRELALFDAVLACIDERWGVDPEHVHSMGFSLGGILTDMLASNRSDVIAAVATYSGGYWNNPANVDAFLANAVMWPEYMVDEGYPQLLLHGGPTDLVDMVLVQLHFDAYAEADSTFLGERGHDTIVCNHGLGHTAPPPEMQADRLIEFFADHPYGTVDSPYVDGLPDDFADYCEFRSKAG
jgi:dienelactone hydrolase